MKMRKALVSIKHLELQLILTQVRKKIDGNINLFGLMVSLLRPSLLSLRILSALKIIVLNILTLQDNPHHLLPTKPITQKNIYPSGTSKLFGSEMLMPSLKAKHQFLNIFLRSGMMKMAVDPINGTTGKMLLGL
jgi:hypothetical protein